MDWADTAERLSGIFGAVGTLALGIAVTALGALVILWRALRLTDGKHDLVQQELFKIVGANTESHERNANAQREGSRAIVQLGETMDRLGQTMREVEEQRRHNLDLILRDRAPLAAPRRARRRDV